MKSILKKATAALACVLLFTGCAKAPAATPTPTPIVDQTVAIATQTPTPAPEKTAAPAVAFPTTVADLQGNEVTLKAPAQKIICLSAASTEIVYALGFGDKVVAVDSYSDYPEAALKLPKVGDYNGVDAETVISMQPDIVFAGYGVQAKVVAQLKELGIPVFVNEAQAYNDIYLAIEKTAELLGGDANAVIEPMRDKENAAMIAAAADSNKPKVYYAISYGESGDFSCGKGAFMTDMLAMMNAASVTADNDQPWPQVSMEQIVIADPDIIIVSGDKTFSDALSATEGYKDLRAVKEGRVYPIDANISSRAAPRIVDALELLQKILHPGK